MIKILFALALAVMCTWEQASAEVEPRTILIHFDPASEVAQSWLRSGRTGQITILKQLLGEHTTEAYISDATLICVDRALATRTALYKSRPHEPLYNIAVVRYASDIEPDIAAAKLRNTSGISYCEPLPRMHIVGETNDPLLAQQYYIPLIKAQLAWDSLSTGTTIVVGIADTGIDTSHIDLRENIWRNPGETGTDEMGADRRLNKLDDDKNGFVDDWYGWDFVGSTGQNEDNAPLPGNPHGTHVGGTVAAVHNNAEGIAGVGKHIILMPLKIGGDDQFSTSISRSADAILYAASMGASIINCSFGSPSSSFADIKVIQQAAQLGALVVGAAGNDGQELAYYPGAYDEVLSVAATDFSDRIATFSNVHRTVDVCAPGVSILATVPNDRYETYDGTSMAAPIASAVAAMVRLVHPEYTPAQTHATMRASCADIDSLNPSFIGLIGNGRIDASIALSAAMRKWATVSAYTVTDNDKDSVFDAGDTLSIEITLTNTLRSLDSCYVRFTNGSTSIDASLLDTAIAFGPVAEDSRVRAPRPLRIVLPEKLPDNGQLRILAHIFDRNTRITTSAIQTVVNPTYRTIHANDIEVTVNSSGNIGFNDYSSNTQGVGFLYKNIRNILYEGALLIGTGPDRLPNVARGVETSIKDNSFRIAESAVVRSDSISSGLRVRSHFTDEDDLQPLGVEVASNVIALRADSTRNTLLIVLRVSNTTDSLFTNLHVAEFFDFDIGDAGEADLCEWDPADQILHLSNTKSQDLPRVGLSMISPLTINAFSLDNEGSSDCPSIYDDFVRAEKWFVMTGGIRRSKSRVTDVSGVIGAGPIRLAPDSTVEVCFAVAAGFSTSEVQRGMRAVRAEAKNLGFNVGESYIPAIVDEIISVSGGTVQSPGARELTFRLSSPASVRIDLVDVRGAFVSSLYADPYIDAGEYDVPINIPSVASGLYFIRLGTNRGQTALPVFISAAD
ncbi:MAG: S8 family serine peptidase [Ignavibacteria bacterium]|jgi:serine protease